MKTTCEQPSANVTLSGDMQGVSSSIRNKRRMPIFDTPSQQGIGNPSQSIRQEIKGI